MEYQMRTYRCDENHATIEQSPVVADRHLKAQPCEPSCIEFVKTARDESHQCHEQQIEKIHKLHIVMKQLNR